MDELDLCPFCGSEADICVGVSSSVPHEPTAYICCKDKGCRVRTPVYTGYDGSIDFIRSAIKAWNRRVIEGDYDVDKMFHENANYCTDKSLVEQRALHETLNRLLWRFSMEHGGDEIEWDNYCTICLDRETNNIVVSHNLGGGEEIGTIRFEDEEVARHAIEEVLMPFMKEHPEFIL